MATELPPFKKFKSIPRLYRDVVITEKIDGTCSTVFVSDWGDVFCGAKDHWLSKDDDNYDFWHWTQSNKADLLKLGPGFHSGEYWGFDIGRSYGCKKGERYFSLFNTSRWSDPDKRPSCCLCVPVLYSGVFNEHCVDVAQTDLRMNGSKAKPGYKHPEGIVLYHTAADMFFKRTLKEDHLPKTLAYRNLTRASYLRENP